MKRIIITPGEPAGIGPDITLQIAHQHWDAEIVTVCDPELLVTRAKQLGIVCDIQPFDSAISVKHQPNTLKNIPVFLNAAVTPGILNAENSPYVLQTLKIAADLCLQKKAHAMVTGPVSKGVMQDAGIAFSGHTEFLAEFCQVKKSVMLFVTENFKVALLTTHLPLKDISKNISRELLIDTINIIHDELKNKFHLSQPKILVAGLNPHAGENGHLGREEIDILIPAIHFLQQQKINVVGPVSADVIFTKKYLAEADCILAMYHDQALPLVKYASLGHAVNLTLGLPIIRTSVDHGVALDVAGTLHADAGSLKAAIELALRL